MVSSPAPHRLRRADRHADHPQLLGGRCGPGEGPGRHVGTQVGDVPPPTPDDVGQQGQGQRVVLAGRRAEHDGPPAPTPAVEPGPEATEEAAGDHAGPMLDRDVERALGPPPADGPQRGRHDVQVDLVQLGPGGQRGLDHAPRAPGVTGHQPVLQALGPRRPAAAADRRGRHHRRPVAQLGQRGRGDLPGPRHLARLQQAEADVPVHGHVVHAEQVGDLLQRERAPGLCRHAGRTLVLKAWMIWTDAPDGTPPTRRRVAGRRRQPPARPSARLGRQPCLASQRSLAWRLRSSRWAGTRESTAAPPSAGAAPSSPPPTVRGRLLGRQLEGRGHEALAVVGVQVLDDRAQRVPGEALVQVDGDDVAVHVDRVDLAGLQQAAGEGGRRARTGGLRRATCSARGPCRSGCGWPRTGAGRAGCSAGG